MYWRIFSVAAALFALIVILTQFPQIPTHQDVTLPPTSVHLSKDQTGTITIAITNGGRTPIEYSATVDFYRNDTQVAENNTWLQYARPGETVTSTMIFPANATSYKLVNVGVETGSMAMSLPVYNVTYS